MTALDTLSDKLLRELLRVSRDTPLGTAEMSDGRGFLQPVQGGDFWLGHDDNGQGVAFRDNRHVFVCAGTRSGKGVSTLIPNMCLWPGSLVVIDPKGENAMVTARRRGNGSPYCEGIGQKVRILDPMNTVHRSGDDFADLKAGFNPLTLIDACRPESIDIASRIADAPIVSTSTSDPYWPDAARGMLKFLILEVATAPQFAPHERNLVTVRRLILAGDTAARNLARLNSPNGEVPSGHHFLFSAMSRNPHFNGLISAAGEMYVSLEANAPRQMAGILQTLATNTEFIDSPGMQACLSRSDFSLSELKTDPKGMSLYLCLPQRYMETHFRWLRMMTALIVGEMERVPQHPACGHPVMMMLDEFPALKRMPVLENAVAQIAGYGVKLVFAVQTLPQLKDLYKDNWETIVANCGVKAFFCNDDHFTRDYVSKLIGEREIVRPTYSQTVTFGETSSRTGGSSFSRSSSSTFGSSGGNLSNSYTAGWTRTVNASETRGHSSSRSETYGQSIHKRPLLTPDEIGREFGNPDRPRLLVLVSGRQPVSLRRTAYHQNRWFWMMFDRHRDHPPPQTCEESRIFLEKERLLAEKTARQEAEIERIKSANEEREKQWRANALREREEKWRNECQIYFGVAFAIGIAIPLFLILTACMVFAGDGDEWAEMVAKVLAQFGWSIVLGLSIFAAWSCFLYAFWF